MSEINQVEVLIKPQVPKVIDSQQLLVYIPVTTITSVSDDFEIDYGQLKLKNPNVAYTDVTNVFSKIQIFEGNAIFNSGFTKAGGYNYTLPDKSGTIALLSDIVSGSGLVDDVQVNGQSIVKDKIANIVVDTKMDEKSSNPIANSIFATQVTALGTSLIAHVNNKNNPHSVTKAQVGLGNVDNTSDANKPVSTAQAAAIKEVDDDLITHKTDTTNPHGVTATQVGLGSVDNTSDIDKPVSTKQAAAIKVVQDDVTSHKNNKSNPHGVTASQVGLGNVNNTSDANKPVSTAQKAALDLKMDKAGGTFSGNVAIQGNLTVSGTTTTETEKQLAIKENVIVTNADKANLQTLLSGLAINKNSTATYGIMYDPADDTVKFGEGTLDANRKFVFKSGEGHPLAIRADSSKFTAGHLVKWDATKKQLVDAGKDIDGVGLNTLTKTDLVYGDLSTTYDTVDGLTVYSTMRQTFDGTNHDSKVEYTVPIIGSDTISIDLDSSNNKLVVKVDTRVIAQKSDLNSYAKTADLNSYVKTTTLTTTLQSYVTTTSLNTTLGSYAKISDLSSYAKTADVVLKTQIGAASGVASLGTDGKVPSSQLPTIDNYSKFSEVKLQNSNIVPAYSASTGITVTSIGSMKHANDVVDTPSNTMVVPITAGTNMSAAKSGNLIVFAADAQVGVGTSLPAGSSSQKIFIKTDENYEGGGVDIDIVQTIGQSTTAVMSQKAVTDAITAAVNSAIATALNTAV